MLTPENSPKYLLVGYINYVETAISFVDNEVPMSYGEWLFAYEHCHESQVEQPNVKKDINEKLIEYLSDIFYLDFCDSRHRACELAKKVVPRWTTIKKDIDIDIICSFGIEYEDAENICYSLSSLMNNKNFVKLFC